MRFAFHKMHGLGNDFVVIDAREAPVAITAARARAIADRRQGIGCDQLILLERSATADAAMRIWNPDGSEVEACGNASRAVALLLGRPASIETAGGTLALRPKGAGASVELAAPHFEWDAIPLAYAMDTSALPVAWEDLRDPVAVNVGNPHLVFFVSDVEAIDLARLGPLIEHDPLFPERINVMIASIASEHALTLRPWERGAGLTRACGTGACAAAVAAIATRRAKSPVSVMMPGGDLSIAWVPGGGITMTGPAAHVFTGEADMADFG